MSIMRDERHEMEGWVESVTMSLKALRQNEPNLLMETDAYSIGQGPFTAMSHQLDFGPKINKTSTYFLRC